jgi:Tfp pilus assembly protein PilF
MLYEFQKVTKTNLLVGILAKLFLSFTLLTCAPILEAQVSNFESKDTGISGIVRLQGDDRAVSQVLVDVRSLSHGVSRRVLTDLSGQFEIHGLPPDTYEIVVAEPGYEPFQTVMQLGTFSSEVVVYLRPLRTMQKRGNGLTVSVRELKIPGKARDEYQKGLQLLGRNDPAGSLSHFTKAIQLFPEFYEAIYHKGVAEMRLGHKDEAMEAYQKAIDLSGGRFGWAQFAVGYLLCQEGKPGDAEKIIRRGLEVEENAPEGYVLLGNTLMQLNRWDEAERSLQEALIRDPKFADAYLMRSNVSAHKGNYQARLQDLDAYLRLVPTGPASESVREAREATLRILAKQGPQN